MSDQLTRRSFLSAAAVGAAALAACSNGGVEEGPIDAADLVIRGGSIITMVEEGSYAEALAVKDGKLVYVGADDGIDTYIGDATRVIELGGACAMPGFIDGHIHAPGPYLTEETEIAFLNYDVDLEVYKQALADFIAAHPNYDIYLGMGVDLKAFPDSKGTNDWINEVCSDKPVSLSDVSGHGRFLNDVAIELCGITKDTPNPPSGIIYKDGDGELTGYFSDCGAIIDGYLPDFEYTNEDYRKAVMGFLAEANSYGITGMDSGGDSIPRDLLAEMAADGTLTVRYNANFFSDATAEAADEAIARLGSEQRYVSDMLTIKQVKHKVDGVPEGKSSYLLEPYDPAAGTDPDYVSSPANTQEEMTAFTTKMNAAGYQVQMHCMGDASVRMAINAYEESGKANGDPDVRNKITHYNLVAKEDVPRTAENKIICCMQPMWFYYDPFFSPLEEQMFGAERFASEYHIRDLIDAGIMITGSNDYPVTYDFAPLHAIEAGATQCSPYPGEDEQVDVYTRNADQAATVYEMLQMYTVNGAYAAFWEDKAGTLEEGKFADIVVLDKDPLSCDVKEISDIAVLYTISNGNVVYEG